METGGATGLSDRDDAGVERSLVYELAEETIDWMADDPQSREDVADEVWYFALATFIGGGRNRPTVITPRGVNVGEMYGPRFCSWCSGEISEAPPNSTICRNCFFDGMGSGRRGSA